MDRIPRSDEINTPEFQAIWSVIKDWDIGIRPEATGINASQLYQGGTGNHVCAILDALQENKAPKKIEPNKLKCSECEWRGEIKEVLVADNPFEPGESMYGCPTCKCINRFDAVCDEPECWGLAHCGTHTRAGYRNTCGKHKPEKG